MRFTWKHTKKLSTGSRFSTHNVTVAEPLQASANNTTSIFQLITHGEKSWLEQRKKLSQIVNSSSQLFVNEPVAEQRAQLLLTTPRDFQLAFDESLPTKKLHDIFYEH